jgi:hypothetical protein
MGTTTTTTRTSNWAVVNGAVLQLIKDNDQVDAIERGDLLAYRIAEHANGKPCVGI